MKITHKISLFSLSICSFLISGASTAAFGQVAPTVCQSERVKLQMLGTRGPELLAGDDQASTGYLLWLDNKARVIIEAGPGSLLRFKQSRANINDVDIMLFSHFHVDHSADFPAYIKGAFFSDRNKDLFVYGPSGTQFVASATQFVDRAIGSKQGMYPYLGSHINTTSPSRYKIKTTDIPWSYGDLSRRPVYNNKGINVQAVPTHHGPFPSVAYRVTLAGCVISFSGDMNGRLGVVPELVKGSDILVAHYAVSEQVKGVARNLHMKPSYIGELAQQATVKQLLLTHLMKRSIAAKEQSLAIIKKRYKGKVVFPHDLDIFHP
jgi:ribonuclease BN (tRNA processing enzyme)